MASESSNVDAENLEDQPQVVGQRRMLSFLMSKTIPPIPSEEERKPFPQGKANILSKTVFWWLNPIMRVGYKRTVHAKDLFYLTEDVKNENMYNTFRSYFDKYLKKEIDSFLAAKYDKLGKQYDPKIGFYDHELKGFQISPYLIPKCLYYTLFWEYNIGFILKVLSDSATAVLPLLQKKLINFVEYKDLNFNPNTGRGVGYAIGCCLMLLFSALTLNSSLHLTQTCGAKSRSILTRLLLDKSFSIDSKGHHLFTASTVQSMISTDMNRIDLAIGYAFYLFTGPIPIAIAIGLLIWNIGVSALVGIGVFVFIVVILGMFMGKLMSFRTSAIKLTDLRVRLIKEVLNSYKMIKFYSWENSYSERIQKARFSEMKILLKLQSMRNFLFAVSIGLPGLASMATFCAAYAISGSKGAANIFSSLSLFQTLAFQFIMIPFALSMMADMVVSIKKISVYLACADLDPKQFEVEDFKDELLAMKVENGCFEWDTFKETDKEISDNEKGMTPNLLGGKLDDESRTENKIAKTEFPGLKNVNLEIRKGEFIVVTGSIGSGKSSLLSAMAGLMKKTSGKVYADGDLLLCGYPWVQNATIRENITFGLPFDNSKYFKVVKACSLLSDFKQFTGGDMTEVGERGITLSGGQKARINLARAVYADKDIILLDDVLSAVDAKVGKHIVEECILGLLRNKTRIMATHQLSLINSADRMIFLNGDGSTDIGTISKLKARNEKFVELLQFQTKKDDKGNTDDEGKEEEDDDDDDCDALIEEILDENDQLSGNSNFDLLKEETELMQQKLESQLTKTVTENEKMENNDFHGIVGDEERAVNALSLEVYYNYARLAFKDHPVLYPTLFIAFAFISTFCNYFTNTWLSFWVEEKFNGRSSHFYMGIYIMFAFLYVITLILFLLLISYFCNNAATMLNFRASSRILHVPMAFMDVSPIGRVLNRFTKDTDTVDNVLDEQLRQFLTPLCDIFATIILCIIYIPWFAIAVPFLVIFYAACANYYQSSAREIQRLEAIKRSHVYSHFNEMLTGRDTIKAYKRQVQVQAKLDDFLDLHNEAYYITVANQRWLGAQLSILSFVLVLIVCLLCVFGAFKINAASTGLLLTYVINLTNVLVMLMRALTQVENEFNSVERLNYYAFDLAQEAPYERPETEPLPEWPEFGAISFTNVNMKYRPELPYVLKDVNISINKNEKIGFCGRTGAGKSTFMTCLYRLTEFEGEILIDGVDISKLGLHKLRSQLTIIPQDPVLFMGTIRENLDPFGEYSNETLWQALSVSGLIETADLKETKQQNKNSENLHKFHLERVVEDDGSNFSIGERQLIALARALVRKTKVLILDEATSSVDYKTDSKIQSTIACEFADCTVLCIAHRLNTIIDYDKIVVMDQGRVIEFDDPRTLFLNENSNFRSMCDQANIVLENFRK